MRPTLPRTGGKENRHGAHGQGRGGKTETAGAETPAAWSFFITDVSTNTYRLVYGCYDMMSYEKNAALPSVKALLKKHILVAQRIWFRCRNIYFADAAFKLIRWPCLRGAINADRAATSYDGWQHDILVSICPRSREYQARNAGKSRREGAHAYHEARIPGSKEQ
ncbi:hypothetical protein [Komagataeibacter xylinus]|uniref:hypothetical protein n=1 Tax=Komagataeibacter xylinus TaxID=28448 RepID=UPI000AA8F247|nr:hypothetical protein [Komagataeibacter xylinus]